LPVARDPSILELINPILMAPKRTVKPTPKAAAAKALAIAKTKAGAVPPSRTTKAMNQATGTSTRATTGRTRSLQPQQPEPDAPIPQTADQLATQISILSNNAAETQDALDEVRGRLDSWEGRLDAFDRKFDDLAQLLHNNIGGSTGDPAVTPLLNGIAPREFISTNMPWIDQTLLASIVSRKLELKDLVRLLPEEDRPKGRSTAGLTSGFHVDAVTGKTTIVTESTVAFDKDLPDFPIVVYALSVYGAIRAIYDSDNVGFGPAIFMYIKLLTRWHKIDNFQWKYIRAYFVAHFRKYQASSNPSDWTDVDVQLFTAHIRSTEPNTGTISTTTVKSPRKKGQDSFCINFNTEGKGCTWNTCARPHVCAGCGKDSHPVYKCKKQDGEKA